MNHFKSTPVFILVLLANIASSYDGVLIDDKRIETIKYRIEHRTEPTYSAYRQLEKNIRTDIRRQSHVLGHWYVPGYYRDAKGHRQAKQGLSDDANAAYRLALMYRLSERSDCAETAIRLIDSWAENVKTMSETLHRTDFMSPPLTMPHLRALLPAHVIRLTSRPVGVAPSYGRNDFAAASFAGR